jgi:hypothetical protein
VLAAKSNDKLLVGLLLASLVEDAHVCLATVKSLGSLTETASESIVDQRDLEDTLEGIKDGHGTGLSGLIGANFDLLGGGDGAGGLFYIRLCGGDVLVVVLVANCPRKGVLVAMRNGKTQFPFPLPSIVDAYHFE